MLPPLLESLVSSDEPEIDVAIREIVKFVQRHGREPIELLLSCVSGTSWNAEAARASDVFVQTGIRVRVQKPTGAARTRFAPSPFERFTYFVDIADTILTIYTTHIGRAYI